MINKFFFQLNPQNSSSEKIQVCIEKDPRIIWKIGEYAVAKELLICGQYNVQSNVSKDHFCLFLDCLINDSKIPDEKITADIYYDFSQLKNEFNIKTELVTLNQLKPSDKIKFIVESKAKSRDISEFEKEIAINLDFYLTNYPKEMYQIDIRSLYNIFYHKERNLMSQEKGYRFITNTLIENNDINNDNEYFILLESLDGDKLFNESSELFTESLVKLQKRNNCMPSTSEALLNHIANRNYYQLQQNELKKLMISKDFKELRRKINDENIKFIVIPEEVTELPDFAFFACRSLQEVIIESKLTSIGESAFAICTSLKWIEIPSSVSSIGDHAFGHCLSLKRFKSPDSLKQIQRYVFDGCKALEEVILHNEIKSLGSLAFYQSNIKELVIPELVKTIPTYMCLLCSFLEKVVLPNNLQKIELEAFYKCISLREINIPNSVIEIGERAFMDCKALKTIKLPPELKSIGKGIFKGCSSLIEIEIPPNIEEIPESAFESCSSLKTVKLPDKLKKINYYSFKLCTSLDKIKIPDSVNYIGNCCFVNCINLREIDLTNIESLSNYTFSGCKSLSKVALSPNLSSIREGVFDGCNIDKIELPKTINHVFSDAFSESIKIIINK